MVQQNSNCHFVVVLFDRSGFLKSLCFINFKQENMYFQLQIHIIQTTTFSATLKKSILAVGLLASTCNLLLHHLPPGCSETAFIDTTIAGNFPVENLKVKSLPILVNLVLAAKSFPHNFLKMPFPQILKLPLDNPGKEGTHLAGRVEMKLSCGLTIRSSGAVSERSAMTPSIKDGSLL